jgi:hypothetical protein
MISDMVLLLVVLTGLVILRRGGGGTSGLTGLLWKQVRWRLPGRTSSDLQFCYYFVHKGVVWLVVGSAAEIPALVSLSNL